MSELKHGDRVKVVDYSPLSLKDKNVPGPNNPNGRIGTIVETSPDDWARKVALLMTGLYQVYLGEDFPTPTGDTYWLLAAQELEKVG